MLSAFRKFLEPFLRLGVASFQARIDQRNIRLTNGLSILMGSIAIPYLVIYVFSGQWGLWAMNVVYLVNFMVVLFLNHKRKHLAARWYFVISTNTLFGVPAFLLGQASGMHFGFFILACVPFLLFSFAERISLALSVFLPWGLFTLLTAKLFQYSPNLVYRSGPPGGGAAEGAAIFSALIFVVAYFRFSNEKSEGDLESTVGQLRGALAKIATQQQVLSQAAKMSALGEMAGGIAHEINNPLAVIQLRVAYLRNAMKKGALSPEGAEDSIRTIEETVWRISKIILGLKSFAREGENDPFLPVPVRTLVDDTLALCRERFHTHSIRLIAVPVQADLVVECRAVQVSQIILNLLNNSFDSVNADGEKWVRIAVSDSGADVEIEVVDGGSGIPAELRQKIFQPFFTTKGPNRGTGLGLSISKGIAEGHGGILEFDYASPHTRCVLKLPKRQSSLQPRLSQNAFARDAGLPS